MLSGCGDPARRAVRPTLPGRGDKGYVKIARGRYDCGVTTNAIMAVVDDKYVTKKATRVRYF